MCLWIYIHHLIDRESWFVNLKWSNQNFWKYKFWSYRTPSNISTRVFDVFSNILIHLLSASFEFELRHIQKKTDHSYLGFMSFSFVCYLVFSDDGFIVMIYLLCILHDMLNLLLKLFISSKLIGFIGFIYNRFQVAGAVHLLHTTSSMKSINNPM